jgi:hypothetical protein
MKVIFTLVMQVLKGVRGITESTLAPLLSKV